MDANKTELTHRLTVTACNFLSARGFELVEGEVQYPGGIADIAAFGGCSFSQLKELGASVRFLYGSVLFGDVHIEAGQSQLIVNGKPREHIATNGPITAIVEVKQSWSDFMHDAKKGKKFSKTYAHLNYLAYPHGLLKESHLPDGWFGLEMTKDGNRVWRLRRSVGRLCDPDLAAVKDWVCSIAFRRYKRDTYKWWHDLYAEIYERETPRAASGRLLMLIGTVISCLSGANANHWTVEKEVQRLVKNTHLHAALLKRARELDRMLAER